MNHIKYIIVALLVSILYTSCEREYTPPPLDEPKYEGPLDNISIKQLKERFSSIDAPKLIEDNLIIKGIVTGNDEAGNIYKQLYIQDASGAINIGIDQNSIYGVYQVGQEVFVHLQGLYMVKYGGELQIGLGSSSANRIGWEVFQEHAFANSWPDANKAIPQIVELSALKPEMAHTLVEIQHVTFTNGGKNTFSLKDATTNEEVKDAAGNRLDVRTSNYSTFSQDMLPTGPVTLVGILGRFNGGWQLLLRTRADVKGVTGEVPTPEPEEPVADAFFKETFGKGSYPSGNRPKINDFTDFDMKAPIQYSDATGVADVRSVSGENGANVWFPANRDSELKIEGINTLDKGDVTLKFQLAANVYDAGAVANINNMKLMVNGVNMPLPNKELSQAANDAGKFYNISVPGIPQAASLTIVFISSSDSNKIGFRVDNIELSTSTGEGGGGSGDPIIVTD